MSEVLTDTPDSWYTLFLLGKVRYRLGDHVEALKLFSECIKQPEGGQECVYVMRAYVNAALRSFTKAYADIEAAFEFGDEKKLVVTCRDRIGENNKLLLFAA